MPGIREAGEARADDRRHEPTRAWARRAELQRLHPREHGDEAQPVDEAEVEVRPEQHHDREEGECPGPGTVPVRFHDRQHGERSEEEEELRSDVEEGTADEDRRDGRPRGEDEGATPAPADPRREAEGREHRRELEERKREAAAGAVELVVEDLAQPLLVEPRGAAVGVREHFLAGHGAVVDDVAAGRHRPPEVGARHLLRGRVERVDRDGGDEEEPDADLRKPARLRAVTWNHPRVRALFQRRPWRVSGFAFRPHFPSMRMISRTASSLEAPATSGRTDRPTRYRASMRFSSSCTWLASASCPVAFASRMSVCAARVASSIRPVCA